MKAKTNLPIDTFYAEVKKWAAPFYVVKVFDNDGTENYNLFPNKKRTQAVDFCRRKWIRHDGIPSMFRVNYAPKEGDLPLVRVRDWQNIKAEDVKKYI